MFGRFAIRAAAFLATGAAALSSPAALAAPAAESAYTRHEWDKCRKIGAQDDTVTRRCEGQAGVPILYSGGEDGASVAFGAKGMRGDFPLSGFFFPKQTVEWRSAGGKPFAAILRYDVGKAIGGPFRTRLVIYKLEGAVSSCIVGSLDGGRPDANEAARRLADTRAQDFDCGRDKAENP